jgi:integrase
MASISHDGNGLRRILFFGPDGKRHAIHLGRMTQKNAESFRARIAEILGDKALDRRHDDDLVDWIRNVDDKIHKKLAAKALVPPRQDAKQTTLGPFIDRYVATRSDVKKGTAITYGHVRRSLISKFGAGKPLADITITNANEWRIGLGNSKGTGEGLGKGEGLGPNTVKRRCSIARQFFKAAVEDRLIAVNPFGHMKKLGVRGNKERQHFIKPEDAQRVLDACPDAQWRLIFALSRFGGFRCPSEHLALRWNDVDFVGGKFESKSESPAMFVRSPKTAHHEGHESRVVPMFPELRPYLEDAFELAEEGAEFVITGHRDAGRNLRTTFKKIIRRAGLEPWPKLFQNLRSTRQTELEEIFPSHVVCGWMGNSEKVAREHYSQTTVDHFAKAVAGAEEKAAQNPAQTAANQTGPEDTEALPESEMCFTVSNGQEWSGVQVGPEGFEPPTKGL